MDVGSFSLLESVTQKTLHAHNFNRASSEASHVLTDLLSRYVTLLATTCTQYAEHAGRPSVSVGDAIMALDELGVSLDELMDFGEVEGRDMSRYAISTARREEELSVLKASLMDGLRTEQDDVVQLVYAPVPSPPPSDVDDDESDEERSGDSEMEVEDSIAGPSTSRGALATVHSPLALPPSPISRSPSPPRKRQRTSTWSPPSYIPDFLPPFPSSTPPPSPPPTHDTERQLPRFESQQQRMLTPPPQLASSTTGSDYLTPVPYSMSSLRTIHESHFPERPDPRTLAFANAEARHATPQPSEALISAYHYVLTNPPPPHPPTNPHRHKVALSLLTQMYTTPRWTVSDTMFSNLVPPKPRVLAPSPSFPIALKDVTMNGDQGKDKRQLLVPPSTGKSVIVTESITPLSSQAKSRIPDIASQILPPSVLIRATRVNHPLPLISASNEKLIYGSGVPAPWNSTPSTSSNEPSGKSRDRGNSNATVNGAGAEGSEERQNALADARLFATWDWEVHDFRQPIQSSLGKRWRAGSIAIPHRPSISIAPSPVTGPTKRKTKDGKMEKGK